MAVDWKIVKMDGSYECTVHPTKTIDNYDADYRTKIAKEIFAEIESNCYGDRDEDNGEYVICIYAQEYDELKKKYGIKNDETN